MHLRPLGTAIGLLVLLAQPFGVPAGAQVRRPMTLIDLAEVPRVQDAQLSPDGRFVSYQLARADWRANRQVAHLFRQAVAGGAPEQLTSGDAGETSARWSPDGQTLLYLSRAESGLQIFLVPSGGGPPRQLTHHGTGVFGGAAPQWSPDGSSIFFLASDAQADLVRQRQRLKDDVYAYDEDFLQRHLWRVTVGDGTELRITTGSFSVMSFRLSRDGSRIAQHRAPSPLIADITRGEVWTSDVVGGATRVITSNRVEELEAEFSPDNSQLLFLAEANERLEPTYRSSIFLVGAAGGAPRRLLPQFPYAVEHATWSPDGKSVLAVVNMGVHSEIFSIEVASRRPRALTDGQHSVQFWSVAPSAGRMVFQLDEPARLGDAWVMPVGGGTSTRVTGVYDSLAHDFELPRQEKASWRGVDGATVEGVLYYPSGYQLGQRYPLVVQLHGGPQESDKFGYGPGFIVNYVPVLTSHGYAVLRPNFRGSAGYGDVFLRDVVGKYFKNMHFDVMAGVDSLVARGIADPDRLAVMGWSAGGHLTNKLITFSHRFKAAASSAGVANWISLFAQSDIRSSRTAWFGGVPWGPGAPIDLFWNSSPLKDASRVRTPTIFIAGENDSRVPMSQAVEMYRALRANGVPTRLWVAPREGHQWSELRHQIAKANLEMEWFDRHVRERPYVWERAPGDPPEVKNSSFPQ
ncbi:MAG: S9 family peptidase [Vicinamibacterales bacterium]